jgi:hypothetical protein
MYTDNNTPLRNIRLYASGELIISGAMSAIGLAAKAVQNAILQWRADELKKVRQ